MESKHLGPSLLFSEVFHEGEQKAMWQEVGRGVRLRVEIELEIDSDRDRKRDQSQGTEMGKEKKRQKDSDGGRDIQRKRRWRKKENNKKTKVEKYTQTGNPKYVNMLTEMSCQIHSPGEPGN